MWTVNQEIAMLASARRASASAVARSAVWALNSTRPTLARLATDALSVSTSVIVRFGSSDLALAAV